MASEVKSLAHQTAASTQDVAQNIAGVSQAANATANAAALVLGSAGELARQTELLGIEVSAFVQKVRAA